MLMQLLIVLKLFLAAVLGATIGWERKVIAEKEAGIKTYAIISLGAALFTVLSYAGFAALTKYPIQIDPTRIAAEIVIAAGFLGAGSIIFYRGHIEGLTTAAEVWLAAAIGMTVGVGWYLVAILTTAIVFASLYFSNKVIIKKE